MSGPGPSSYSGFIRVRVGGIFLKDEKVLLVKLKSPISGEEIWIPPGGGVEFKGSLEAALIREFEEETNLKVRIGELVHVHELVEKEFHAIEFFFKIESAEGEAYLGADLEYTKEDQMLKDIGFFSKEEVQSMNVKPNYLKEEFWKEKKGFNLFR